MKSELNPVPGRILISEETIQRRVAELGAQISRDFAGKRLHLLAVLRGAIPFLADLARHLSLDVTFDFIAVSGDADHLQLIKDLDHPIEGRDVLLVEDLISEGETLRYMLKTLKLRHPASLKVCTMFDRYNKRDQALNIDYVGIQLNNSFVVGYGLDYKQMYRNLPYVAELKLLT